MGTLLTEEETEEEREKNAERKLEKTVSSYYLHLFFFFMI